VGCRVGLGGGGGGVSGCVLLGGGCFLFFLVSPCVCVLAFFCFVFFFIDRDSERGYGKCALFRRARVRDC